MQVKSQISPFIDGLTMFRNDAGLSMEYRTIELENFSSVTPKIEKPFLFNSQAWQLPDGRPAWRKIAG
ncbi:hypothetical protein K0M31_005536 [Melipona bicolor]|uniref:Uncharacterized protein n=1 Tax=Melipona bicolor TaxID=60889 RepID=A0AA40FVK2_9HYME|nr:hypothetical protein K0M31_005536 [Melipona bicolor]